MFELVIFWCAIVEVVALPQLDVVWCSAAVVVGVVWWSCSRGVLFYSCSVVADVVLMMY